MPKRRPPETGDGFDLTAFLPQRLVVAAQQVTRLMLLRHLNQSGLSLAEWRLLAVVGRHPGLSLHCAGVMTALDKSKLSRTVNRLVILGLMKQTHHDLDRRARLIRLTNKGVRLAASVTPVARQVETILATGLSPAEWTTLQQALGKLNSHVGALLGTEED